MYTVLKVYTNNFNCYKNIVYQKDITSPNQVTRTMSNEWGLKGNNIDNNLNYILKIDGY